MAAAFVSAGLAATFAVAPCPPTRADTWGESRTTGGGVLAGILGIGGILQPNDTNGTSFVPLAPNNPPRYGFIANEYIGAVVGDLGAYGVNFGGVTANHIIPGRISFGNTGPEAFNTVTGQRGFGHGGSLRPEANTQYAPLVGFNVDTAFFSSFLFTFTFPIDDLRERSIIGYGVWPLASSYINPGYDYSGYTRALIDPGTANAVTVNVIGDPPSDALLFPSFRTVVEESPTGGGRPFRFNVLESIYRLLSGDRVTVRQRIRLLRSTARIEYRVTNNDTVSHNVALRLTLNIIGSTFQGIDAAGNLFPAPNSGVYFTDPRRGLTNRPITYNGADVPAQLDVLNQRANALTTAGLDQPGSFDQLGFIARHTLRPIGSSFADATPPDLMMVRDSDDLQPEDGGFFPGDYLTGATTFEDGLATGVVWGPFSLSPGQTRTIVTYYGSGNATEENRSDFILATEATGGLQFNAAAAEALSSQIPNSGASSATLQTGAAFLSPRPFRVYGSIYNAVLNDPEFNVSLNNVTMSLNLPPGLRFAPRDGGVDQSVKVLGQIRADSDGRTDWLVEPTGETFGALPYQVSVASTERGTRTVSRVVNVPATPLHPVRADGFQMISFPFAFDPALSNNSDPATIVNGISRPVDDPVAFFRWIPDPLSVTGEGRYQIADRIEPGLSYFYRANVPRVIFARGARPVANQAPLGRGIPTPYQIVLNRGWNMIANPYVYEIPLNFLRIAPASTEENPLLNSFNFTDAVAAGYVRGGVFFYNTDRNQYDFFENFADALRPWQGYWIFANNRVILVYSTPTQSQSAVLPGPNPADPFPPTRKREPGAIVGRAALVKNPTLDEWKLQLVAHGQDGRRDEAALIGVSKAAKDGDDVRDFPKPPTPVEDYVYVGVTRKGGTGAFAQDLQAPGGAKSWDVEVMADQDGQITLSWPNLGTLPRRLRLKLTDLATNVARDMRGASSVRFTGTKNTPHRFQVTASTMPTQPLAIGPLRALQTRGGRGVTVGFTLTDEATVSGQVKTLNNKLISRFERGRSVGAGENTLRWDGRAQDGSSLPVGAYQIEITAKNADGQVAVQKGSVVLLR